MKQIANASLKHLNSFSVEARAGQLLVLESEHDLQSFTDRFRFDPQRDVILGGGTNVLFVGDVAGSVILNHVTGRKIIKDSDNAVLVEACGGENWHQLVLWSLEQGLSGIENLSLIPGLTGAAPIQNIGAYGVELADVFNSLQALDLKTGELREFDRSDCQFTYRGSRFKSTDAGRFLITRIRLRLQREFTPRLAYSGLGEELQSMGIELATAKQVSDAVIRIRQRKLPDPEITGNAGSFFKNPVVGSAVANLLKKDFSELPVYAVENGKVKLSAAWMIEQCGWKGHREGDAGVSEQHALVLVNHGNASGRQLLDLANAIGESVKSRFGIDLKPEPKIIQS
jgi:UDP-N-acetylmuramate dehydrogenase